MTNILKVKGLHKRFGARVALEGLSFEVPENSVTAFVGANGAGKTTTFSLIGGYFPPDRGSIEIFGEPLKSFRSSGGIVGLLPQDVLFYENRSVARHLILFAKLAGLSGHAVDEEVSRVLRLVQLLDRANDLVSSLSHGMRVRLGVATALVGRPPLVLLDEPTQGLDPKMVQQFRHCIDSLRGTTTVLISSHDLGQLEQICDHVIMIDHGHVVREGTLSALLAQASRITFRLDAQSTLDLGEIQQSFPEFKFSQPEKRLLLVNFDPGQYQIPEVNSRVLFWLFRHKVGVLGVESVRSLEQTYLEATTPGS